METSVSYEVRKLVGDVPGPRIGAQALLSNNWWATCYKTVMQNYALNQ